MKAMKGGLVSVSERPLQIAIVSATRYGQTSKIASFLEDRFKEAGLKTEHILVGDSRTPVPSDLTRFDAIVIGCPVYVGKFLPELVAWTKAHAPKISTIPLAFFSVSLNAADVRTTARLDDDRLLREFINLTGIEPSFVASIAGAIHYRKYGFFKRFMLRRISKAAGGPTDTSKDHELTNWDQVRSFADAFAKQDSLSQFATANRSGMPQPTSNSQVARAVTTN